ncbi:hypothetical protein A3B45_02675 [Candidatus Daviesbacteria bacterium RIFCSPLOWO2_01_FULL_39_12]|uniref:Uncharacterized protein n=1 Tax=Candidatus Daviesbacteria bacterium RIFCSPLOWO2_01_FULL_39_12 TaxID=1797785 RepID=A0A1F5KSW2_9BACT|nr:MAG: hypothetical protein A3B45_02675 [Candidatus Daviesbacteria bacterium RIFCSPLOWO2_01_FULL_39_12]
MRDRDIKWFQYLARALREKYRLPNLEFYGPYSFQPTIFKWVRDTFGTIHQKYGIDYSDYLNINERPVLEKLVENLGKDSRLNFLNNPQALAEKELELPEEFHQQVAQEQISQQQTAPQSSQLPQAPSGQMAPPTPGGPAIPQMPPLPNLAEQDQTQPEKTEEEPPAETAQPGRGRRISLPRVPSGVSSYARGQGANLGSTLQRGVGRAVGGAGNSILKFGGRGINFGINFGSGFSNRISRLSLGNPSKKWLIVLLLLLFLVAVVLIIPGSIQPPPSPAPGPIAGDISQCIFYRGGDMIQGIRFNNPALPTLITNISNKVGVPPAMVAGIMRVETPSAILDSPTSDYVANDYDAHCSIDPNTGQVVACGVMQFTPNTFSAVFQRNQSELQTLFGKTDATTNIDPQDAMAPDNVFRIYSIEDSITAAAYKVREDKQTINGDGPWDQTTVYEIARRYYGALEYSGWDGSTQNYGADLWRSYSECKATAVSACTTPPAGDLKQAILNTFSIVMNGFDQKQLAWAWEKLSCASSTNFINLVKGTVVTRVDGRTSEQTGCKTINLANYGDRAGDDIVFKVALTHEMSHVIDNCIVNELSHSAELYNIVYPGPEGGLTTYAREAPYPGCIGPGQESEDYAEMLAYYLNLDASEIGPCLIDTIPPNPYKDGAHPEHYLLAKTILGSAPPSSTPAPASGLPQFSCPVSGGGKNILPSYQLELPGTRYGHCGDLYVAKEGGIECSDGRNSRRAKSVDIETCINPRPPCKIDTCPVMTPDEFQNVYKCGVYGKDIQLPTIEGNRVDWEYINFFTLNGTTGNCFDYEMLQNDVGEFTATSCGDMYVFKTTYGSDTYALHLLHLAGGAGLALNSIYPSGTPVGKAKTVHTHISIGKNVTNPTSQDEPGWMPADKDFNICGSGDPANEKYK